jgi:glycosyltransferase involved in cell wall biosynthesis
LTTRPTVWLVGSDDIDARLELMRSLRHEFSLTAVGSKESNRALFESEGFGYHSYRFSDTRSLRGGLAAMAELTSLFRQGTPEIVHAFDTAPAVWARIAAWRARVPVIVGTLPGLGRLYAEDRWPVVFKRAAYARVQKFASRISAVTTFQNDDDRRQFVAAGIVRADRSVVIRGSGVDTGAFSRASVDPETVAALRQELAPDGGLIVLMVSRLTRLKGVPEFVASARKFASENPALTFVLVGSADSGVYGLPPEDMTRIAESVRWLGRRDDVASLFAAADMFVLPTTYREGIPRVLLEAAAMELPLIATDVPGCREVVIDGVTGRLLPPGDQSALDAAIADMAHDPDRRRRMAQAARRHVIDHFGLPGVASASASLYRSLLSHV